MPNLTPTVLSTARLRLRWMIEADAPAHFAVFSDPEVTRFWSSGPWTDMQQAVDAIGRELAAYRDGSAVRFAVELADQPGLIGTVSLHRFVDQSRRCEIGYAFGREHWNKGYAAEAAKAVLDYGFRVLDLNRVEADIDPRNLASARVLERLGFRKEGFLPERWIVQGEPADTLYYGLLRRYWDALPFVGS
ncbi:GNAT family N-acetyltransferase [Massilia solisilvae]|uniref:GNAT family N-acetyltransferase n=1 Tax=Massilia solisilvae TaxID=1811225 RepID=A0ABT2BI45_9BURK|nr:GNAT family N-acetyltransferase [Massilia solisilvae]MCS0608181.1 GNAT family N-acetyltransferase [Massilia solisilvae]